MLWVGISLQDLDLVIPLLLFLGRLLFPPFSLEPLKSAIARRKLPFTASSLSFNANRSTDPDPSVAHRSSAIFANRLVFSRRAISSSNSCKLGGSDRECRNQLCHCATITNAPNGRYERYCN